MTEAGLLGADIRRPDGVAKVTGAFAYAADVDAPGALWGATVRSPHPAARLLGVDATAALALPGVRTVLTAADIPGLPTYGLDAADQPVLVADECRYHGQPVALVAADTPQIARRAAELIEVRWEVLAPVTDPAEALRVGAPRYRELVVQCGTTAPKGRWRWRAPTPSGSRTRRSSHPKPRWPGPPPTAASRPGTAEDVAVARLIVLARRTGARVHVLHLSSTGALPMIADARADGVRISAETCPHYLTFAAADVPDGATQFKCCPPIRAATNREVLWTALQNNVIGLVVSDHSPCTPELKELATGDFGRAWGGVASLQLGLSAVWTGAHARGLGLSDVVGWMSQAPADLVGLHRKGRIAVGADADLVVFAPDEEFTVDAARLEHRNPVTPYDGRRLRGVVRETWLRGARIDRVNARGRLLRR